MEIRSYLTDLLFFILFISSVNSVRVKGRFRSTSGDLSCVLVTGFVISPSFVECRVEKWLNHVPPLILLSKLPCFPVHKSTFHPKFLGQNTVVDLYTEYKLK